MKPSPKTCTAKKHDGTSCQAAALPGRAFCFFHDPARASARRKAQSRGGLANRMATLPPDAPAVKIADALDAIDLICETVSQVRRGEIDPRVANSVGFLTNVLFGVSCKPPLPKAPPEAESRQQYDVSVLTEEELRLLKELLNKTMDAEHNQQTEPMVRESTQAGNH